MRKMTLDLNALAVESFATESDSNALRGTVRGVASDFMNNPCKQFPFTQNPGDTFFGTCAIDGCVLTLECPGSEACGTGPNCPPQGGWSVNGVYQPSCEGRVASCVEPCTVG